MSSRMCNMTFSMKPKVAASGTVEESVITDDTATDSAVPEATDEVEPETAPEADGNTVPAATSDGPVIEIVIPEVKDAPKKPASTKEPSSKGGRRVVITEGE